MKTKIVGVFICMLLMAVTALPVTGNITILHKQYELFRKQTPLSQEKPLNLKSPPETLDLAITLAETSQVQILLGDGIGGFASYNFSTVGGFPLGITSGDYNKDGFIDLITTSMDNNTFTVLLGNGTGSFTQHEEHGTGMGPFHLITGFFDEDENPDIAVAHLGISFISIYYGDGLGSFGTPENYDVGYPSSGLTTADFNNDDNTDLVILCASYGYEDSLTVFLGDGLGGFINYGIYSLDPYASYSITHADFNNDQNLDIAIGCGVFPYVGVLLGDGLGGFGPVQNFTVGYGGERFDLVTDDFNHDGNEDIAIPNTDEDTISILLGDGTGGFAPHQAYAVGGYPVGMTKGDFNADGHSDLAVTNTFSNTLSVLLGDGTGEFGSSQHIAVGLLPVGIVAADFDNLQYIPVPDLSCSGTLDWTDIKPGATIYGEFEVKNSGEAGSLLDWEIISKPTWGTWTFTPDSGMDLADGDSVKVNVTVVAPDEKLNEFSGNITIVNMENSSDYCIIPVSLKTPQSQVLPFHNFFIKLFHQFPKAFPLLRYIMSY